MLLERFTISSKLGAADTFCAAASILLIVALVYLLAVGRSPKTKMSGGESKSKETGAVDKKCCCASCGIAELDDDVKLKPCDRCDLVRYCSDACQELHIFEHAGKCRKRAAELRDVILFKQPEGTHQGDCPICCLPLPFQIDKSANRFESSRIFSCCSKMICDGCFHSNRQREIKERLDPKCPFCRHPMVDEEAEQNRLKRVEANDPVEFSRLGSKFHRKGDFKTAFKYYSKAAELGDPEGHDSLANMYRNGEGVKKNKKKEMYHLEEAAIAGHPAARHNLGCREGLNGRIERAIKHYIIAATLGFDESIKTLRQCYQEGYVSKEDFAAALQAHHAAVNATKSPQREAAALFLQSQGIGLSSQR